MRLARITGTVTATVKAPALTGASLFVTDVIDGTGAVLRPAVVATDICGAGVGDMVLLSQGSSARVPAEMAAAPVDAVIVAIVDDVSMAPARQAAKSRRKS